MKSFAIDGNIAPMFASESALQLERVIEREWRLGHHHLQIAGTTSSTALSLLLSRATSADFHTSPHLVIVPSVAEAQRVAQGIKFFAPDKEVNVLTGFDVSPYSTLYPKREELAERCRFLWRAQNAKPGEIFIAPVEFLIEKTAPFQDFHRRSFKLQKNSELANPLSEFLHGLGYLAAPFVEDVGQYSVRGGIVDIFSPAHEHPIRLELFGDSIESMRSFSPESQKSLEDVDEFHLIPCREFFWSEDAAERVLKSFRTSVQERGNNFDKGQLEELLRALTRQNDFEGIDFLFPWFFPKTGTVIEHFSLSPQLWLLDVIEIERRAETFREEMQQEAQAAKNQHLLWIEPQEIWQDYRSIEFPAESSKTEFVGIETRDLSETQGSVHVIEYPTYAIREVSQTLANYRLGTDPWIEFLHRKLEGWRNEGYAVFFGFQNQSQAERVRMFLDRYNWKCMVGAESEAHWDAWAREQAENKNILHFILRRTPEALRLSEDRVVFLRDEDLFGKKTRLRSTSASEDFQKQAKRLNFGDLKPGDCVVHVLHGIGIYDGLKVMSVGGIENEFIQLSYRDKDKLYLPVYRVGQLQKYSGHASHVTLDKLGSQQWEKTKAKVRNALRDLASELLQLYAKRAELHRPALQVQSQDFQTFEAAFPFDETDDQVRAINDLVKDFHGTRPMDRLICGDVGFGKTEVAMRGAFLAALNKKQVAVLAPTTVLTFQHFETFKKRFQGWPFEIRVINRFVTNTEIKKTVTELKAGKVDIIIGTHRLLSKDVEFKDLGFLVVDEEQKFGVAHKEKIRKLKTGVDTVAMSATPIPRTLNMSLVGIRDLSLINTAPMDRLPTRTFISKWDDETIRKALLSEVQRGGQIYFIHNRVQSIYSIADELRKIVPELRIGVGHGQMEEHELEKTMISFFKHEIDVLVCTTIVESGMDVPRANTMFIDQAHTLGLSQLYQLRGRVGRSKQRAYCYLLLPRNFKLDKSAQERLKVIQENTALGSGIRIAQYDLELRGAGNLLGEQQSGHIDSVGYELYMDLLNEAVANLRGDDLSRQQLEPEINLRIPAMIPENYIGDIRIRLSYYKALSEAQNSAELDSIEEELKDQFGPIPEPTLNLMGLMLIRSQCRELGIKDVSAGPKNLSLSVSDQTRLSSETVMKLVTRENKKYSITPDNRLNIRMNEITWPRAYEELEILLKLI